MPPTLPIQEFSLPGANCRILITARHLIVRHGGSCVLRFDRDQARRLARLLEGYEPGALAAVTGLSVDLGFTLDGRAFLGRQVVIGTSYAALRTLAALIRRRLEPWDIAGGVATLGAGLVVPAWSCCDVTTVDHFFNCDSETFYSLAVSDNALHWRQDDLYCSVRHAQLRPELCRALSDCLSDGSGVARWRATLTYLTDYGTEQSAIAPVMLECVRAGRHLRLAIAACDGDRPLWPERGVHLLERHARHLVKRLVAP